MLFLAFVMLHDHGISGHGFFISGHVFLISGHVGPLCAYSSSHLLNDKSVADVATSPPHKQTLPGAGGFCGT